MTVAIPEAATSEPTAPIVAETPAAPEPTQPSDVAEAPAPAEEAPSAPAAVSETPDLDALVATLSSEQKKAFLGKFDAEELIQLDERLSGKMGALAQKQAGEIVAAANRQKRDADILAKREKAVAERDPDAALEYAQATTLAEIEEHGAKAFGESVKLHESLLANPLTEEFVRPFAGRDYSKAATLADGTVDGRLAAILHRADLASFFEHLPTWEQKVRADERKAAETDPAVRARIVKEERPAIEREVRASLNIAAPAPDAGSGPAANDDDQTFLRAYADGRSNDHARARKLTGVRA